MKDFTPLEKGLQIKQYVLEKPLGRGASGEVWKARDGDRVVAIKFMNERLITGKSAEKHRERLEREIRALSVLQHPNIPRLYDFDLTYERPYLVMQYIDSPSYDRLILAGRMAEKPLSQRLNVLDQLAEVLALAHQKGIVHRDLKPGNIHGFDPPYLLDFSVAIILEQMDVTNLNIGTAIYMDPDGATPDALSDVYAFGAVAYEMLFGRHPIFDYGEPDAKKGAFTRIIALNRLRGGDWRKPAELPLDMIPADLHGVDMQRVQGIFETVLGPREHRYHDPRQFVVDLRAALNMIGVPADTVEPIPAEALDTSNLPENTNPSFTMLEVSRSQRNLSPEDRARLQAAAQQAQSDSLDKRLLIAAAVVAVLALVVIILLLLPNM